MNKLILCTGAPGSAWSMICQRMRLQLTGYDMTDQSPDRMYRMPIEHTKDYYVSVSDGSWRGYTHNGAYFGPHHEYGHGFDDLTNYSKDEFFTECLKPFSDDSQPLKQIKCHWFAYNLDWIWENCKGQDLLLIWREPQAAKDWWFHMGGFGIYYPIYKWYVDEERMWEKIQEETKNIADFAQRKNLKWDNYSTEWVTQRFPEAVPKSFKAEPNLRDTIKVCYTKIE
jgi:hypothetical protein